MNEKIHKEHFQFSVGTVCGFGAGEVSIRKAIAPRNPSLRAGTENYRPISPPSSIPSTSPYCNVSSSIVRMELFIMIKTVSHIHKYASYTCNTMSLASLAKPCTSLALTKSAIYHVTNG
jgi:hypothetical protein